MIDLNKSWPSVDHPAQLQERSGQTDMNTKRVASIFICKSAQAVNTNSKRPDKMERLV